jgi:hypothetical protein
MSESSNSFKKGPEDSLEGESNKETIITFESFLREKGISPDDARIPLIKEVWNTAIEAAGKVVEGSMHDSEGMHYDLENEIRDRLGITG